MEIISKKAEDTSDEEYTSTSHKTAEVKTISKGKVKNIRDKDTTFKNPISTLRGKKKIPESVNRDRAKLEKEYTREEWLKLGSVELGEAGLAHLAEIERQRYMCGNLSGKVDGMLKDCNIAASNIIEALVEKLEATGDVTHLKTQNLKLREDLSEARRKINRQDQEITDLRKSIINLEKEVNALKEGWGPFPKSADKPHETGSNITVTSKEKDHAGKFGRQPKRSLQRRENQEESYLRAFKRQQLHSS